MKKINLKNKIMLAVLAGGMLCMNSVFADVTGTLSGGKFGDQDNHDPGSDRYTGTVDGSSTGEYALSSGSVTIGSGDSTYGGLHIIHGGAYVGGGDLTKDITGNTLIVNGGNIGNSGMNFSLFGGYQEINEGHGVLSSNSVIINNGSFYGYVGIYGACAAEGDTSAENNTLEIYDGEFPSECFFCGGKAEYGNVTNNAVTISGGSFGEDCYIYGGSSSSGCSNNKVEISGGSFGDGTNLYGGFGSGSGNTLNLKIKMSGKAANVSHFQIMNFTLPANIANGDIMLNTASVTYDNTTIGVTVADGAYLKKGDIITLIKADNRSGEIFNNGATVLDGAGTISLSDKDLILTMTEQVGEESPPPPLPPEPEPETMGDKEKAPLEAIAAGMAMINQSADLASNEGLNNLVQNTASGTMDTFGALSANRSKYKTGSHVDMDGWGFLVGAGNTKKWNNGEKTTYGLFFEYGKGDFDTYNNDIHGEGDSNNKGVGIIARHTLNNNTYFDANVRYGKQETEWSESEIGSYDTDSKYYGFSVGLGHIFEVGNNELDIYGRYTYGHTGSCDAKVGENEYEFDAVKSSRIRFGAKYNFVQQNKQIKPYVGLAWEREMKGESKATIAGMGEAPAPSLKGNTGIFEIGCDWEAGKWTLGAEANAYIGKRKGWGGMFNAFYNF